MSWVPDRYRELRSLVRPVRVEEDVEEELVLHIELRTADLIAAGMSPEEAREEALRRFGDAAAFREELCTIEQDARRERRRMEIMDTVSREARLALRSLVRAPLFTGVAVLTLGLGIGATTAIFTLIDSIVLSPLPYPEPDRLVLVRHAVPKIGAEQKWGNSVASYFFYLDRNQAFADMGAYRGGTYSLSGDGEAERVEGAAVSASLLRILDIGVVRGRHFTNEEDQPGAGDVALISHELWQSRYGGDPGIVGRSIMLNSSPHTVVGIVEKGARLPQSAVHVWEPLQLDRSAPPVNSHWVNTFARMKPGISPDAAQRDLARLAALMPAEFPDIYSEGWYQSTGFAPDVTPLRDHVLGRMAGVLWILLGAVSVVLLIAGANVANLYLVRSEARRREQTVRAALGAERAHFAAQYLAESILIGMMSAAVGVLLAWAGVRLLVVLAPAGVPRLHEVGLGAGGLAFAAGVSLLVAVLFGLAPVLRGRSNFGELRESGRSMTPSRERQLARSVLVVGQVALALVLLTAGGLMLQSFINLRSVKPGIDPQNVTTFQIFPPRVRYPALEDQLSLRREVTDRIQALPGVTHVSATSMLPFSGESGCVYTTIEGRLYSSTDRPPCMPVRNVLPGYFDAMGIPVAGTAFTWNDVDRAAPGVVVSRAFAQRMWPDQDPIGKGVISYQDGPPWYRVSGIAEDVRADGLDRPAVEAIYYPPRPIEGSGGGGSVPATFVVRTDPGAPGALAESIRGILRSIDPEVALSDVRTMREVIAASDAVARGSFTLLLLGIAGVMALFLSAVGLYGVIAYLVGRRRGEIGVRMALGARVSQVAGLIVVQSLRLAVVGIVIGIAASLVASRALSSLLFEVQPGDPRVLALVSAILLFVALLASFIPARRAALVDPSDALRAE